MWQPAGLALRRYTPAAVPLQAARRSGVPAAAVRRGPRGGGGGAGGGSSVSDGLISVLRDELKVEKERYRTPEEVLAGPPNGFELDDAPHSNSITLSRSFGGEARRRRRRHLYAVAVCCLLLRRRRGAGCEGGSVLHGSRRRAPRGRACSMHTTQQRNHAIHTQSNPIRSNHMHPINQSTPTQGEDVYVEVDLDEQQAAEDDWVRRLLRIWGCRERWSMYGEGGGRGRRGMAAARGPGGGERGASSNRPPPASPPCPVPLTPSRTCLARETATTKPCNKQDEDEDDDEDDAFAPPPVVFTVTVSKGDAMIGFKCLGGGDALRITHVELDDSPQGEGEEEQYTPYTGPVFDELDDTLQQAFVDYLDERGAQKGACRVVFCCSA